MAWLLRRAAAALVAVGAAHEKPPAPADVVFAPCGQADSWSLPAAGTPGPIRLLTGGLQQRIWHAGGPCLTLASAPARFAFVSAANCDPTARQT